MNKGFKKYQPFPAIDFPQRTWPEKKITTPPIWCSIDMRDGNQALADPMDLNEKLEYFKMLVGIGVKEIEIGFPSASEAEYMTARALIDGGYIPDDVTIQVLAPARESFIEKTFEAVKGAKNVIMHFYNTTSELQRRIVFGTDFPSVIKIAERAAKLISELGAEARKAGCNMRYEYTPECFSDTAPDESIEICQRVFEAFGASPSDKAIVNLPTTVERCMPNQFADLVEYFINNFPSRSSAIISIHPHNDRGTGIAAAEMGLLAGAERVEGTLFGNGERTGNMDIMTLAMNMFTQGIDPGLDFSNMDDIRKLYQRCTKLQIHDRHPYAGALAFTAFSGSHQDAINKGLHLLRETNDPYWHMPYLPIDPADVGRKYEPIIRINSQSGKGGAAFIMEEQFGYKLPKALRIHFGGIVQRETDRTGAELSPQFIFELFQKSYINPDKPYRIVRHSFSEALNEGGDSHVKFEGTLAHNTTEFFVSGEGNGPIDAFFNAIHGQKMDKYTFMDYSEHAITDGSDSKAVAYIHLRAASGEDVFGVGLSHNINVAPLRGILSAINCHKASQKA